MPLIPALGRQSQADFWVQGQPGLQSEFQDGQGYTDKSCLKKKKKTPLIGNDVEDVEKEEKSSFIGGSISFHNHFGNQLGSVSEN